MTVGLTARQLEDMIMSRLRGHPDCLALHRATSSLVNERGHKHNQSLSPTSSRLLPSNLPQRLAA